jgi:molybdopterin molybdotransferase
MSALLPVAEAHARLMRLFRPLGTESIALADAAGRVLADDVVATRAQPPFAASAMDGYAVRGAEAGTGSRLRVIGTAAAGNRYGATVGAGEAVRIYTGAPVPDGADFIVIQEDVDLSADERTITIRAGRDRDPYIRPAGGDFSPGARVTAPRRLGFADVTLLAAMGAGRVTVYRRPAVAIIPTGDELVPPGARIGPDRIFASNNYGLKALVEEEGGEGLLLPIARDTPEHLAAALDLAAVGAGADLVVTLGGASVGDLDLVRGTAISRGLDLEFHRIAMRPGKPLLAGRLGTTPMIGLPGNPVSALVCAHLFLRPALARMQGLPAEPPRRHKARLAVSLPANGPREHYMRARVVPDGEGWLCTPFPRQDSSLVSILAEANALLVRLPDDPARRENSAVEFIWFR